MKICQKTSSRIVWKKKPKCSNCKIDCETQLLQHFLDCRLHCRQQNAFGMPKNTRERRKGQNRLLGLQELIFKVIVAIVGFGSQSEPSESTLFSAQQLTFWSTITFLIPSRLFHFVFAFFAWQAFQKFERFLQSDWGRKEGSEGCWGLSCKGGVCRRMEGGGRCARGRDRVGWRRRCAGEERDAGEGRGAGEREGYRGEGAGCLAGGEMAFSIRVCSGQG